MFKAIIFDLDGVLTKSDHYHTSAWKEMCSRWGIPFKESTGNLVRGVSRLDSARIVAAQGNVVLTEEQLISFAEEKNSYYIQLLGNMSAADVIPEVECLLKYLQTKGIPTAVASSSKNAPLILEKTGLKKYFSVIIDGSQITHSKPNPEVFKKAADVLGIPYEDCLVVEDAVSGVQAGLEMGAKVAAVGPAAGTPGVTYSLKETGDLMEVFESKLMPHLRIAPRPVANHDSMITYGGYRITILTDRLFRVECGGFTDEATQVIWYRDFSPVQYTYRADGEQLIVQTSALTLTLNMTDITQSKVSFEDGSVALLDNAENLLGTCSTLDTNGSHLRENPAVNKYDRDHIPLDMGVCARNGVAVYDDSKSLLLYPSGKLAPRGGGMDSYVFAYGHDYKGAVKALYQLCGSTPVVPRWALGNWWCRYWPYTQQEYINLMDNFHHPLEDEGVDFWWVDWQQGKNSGLAGLDPLWALNHYHYLDSVHRRGEGLILSRYAGVGSHRYPVGFSGDIHMDWEFLDYMPYFTATAANVGYGWWSHDIGGHHRGMRDEELYLRWLQFGIFSPINRIHCCPAEVTSKEPWTLTETSRAIAEKWFRFRHKLVPYIYSASWKNTLEGTPLIRSMYYEWPEEEAAYEADHQYMFGDLLVAPITEKSKELGMAEKKVWLPDGIWTDIFTNLTYTGDRWITIYRDSGSMPVFAKAGTILPLDAVAENSCEMPEKMDMFIYTGDGEYKLYEGENQCINFTIKVTGINQQKVVISGNAREVSYHLHFKNVRNGQLVRWNRRLSSGGVQIWN